jgi:hypothetical protein
MSRGRESIKILWMTGSRWWVNREGREKTPLFLFQCSGHLSFLPSIFSQGFYVPILQNYLLKIIRYYTTYLHGEIFPLWDVEPP